MRRAFESFLRGEAAGPVWASLRLPLIPLGLCFGELAALRVWAFERGLRSSSRLPTPVISVGNLVAGGTGKTPFVRMLAQRLQERGERPLVLGRGYGARGAGDALDEEGRSLARDLPGVPVVQGSDRVAAVRPHLAGDHDRTVIILDDGAQHRRIQRDVDIMLVDATCPFGSGWPLPAGTLREFPGALRRANLVVITRADEVSQPSLARLESRIGQLAPDSRVCTARHVASKLLPGDAPIQALDGRTAWLVSGIARPASFRRLAERLGMRVLGWHEFPDHFEYGESDLLAAEEAARKAGAEMILATGKDEPKLSALARPASLPWRFLEVTVVLDGNGESMLADVLSTGISCSRRPDPDQAGEGHGSSS